MSLLQRITTPFGEPEQNDPAQMTMPNAAGETLRERRTQLQLDIEAAAEALCIKPVYLAAIEQGRTEELPGPTYVIGFIRAYANYLGLDSERLLAMYREERAETRTPPDLTLPVPLEERSVPGARVLLTGLVLALCGYGAWYYVSTGERERPKRVAAVPAELQLLTAPAASVQAAPAAPPQFSSGLRTEPQQAAGAPAPGTVAPASGAASAAPEPTAAALPTPDMANAAGEAAGLSGSRPTTAAASLPPANQPAAPSGSIDIRALADSWVQIRDADQGIVFSRVLKAGETYRVPRSGLIMRTGNAGALEVLVDGKPAPSLGALGTLRRNVTLEPDALRAGTAVRG